MKLLVTVDGRQGELEFEREGDVCRFSYRRDGTEAVVHVASLIEAEPGIFSVLLNGRSYEPKVVPGGPGYYVDLAGHRSAVEVRDPRALVRKGRAGIGEGRQSVDAPMPGKVIRVLVEEGQEVEAGAGLVVVEAMKMQNEMKSPKAGKVVQVSAKVGDTVAAGESLAVIE